MDVAQQPTIAELLELILLSESSIDSQAQGWLTATFATIVASFVARNLLSRRMRFIVSGLYLSATFVFASRWYYDAVDISHYQNMLAVLGYESAPPLATAIGRIFLMATGTLATMFFVHFGATHHQDDHGDA